MLDCCCGQLLYFYLQGRGEGGGLFPSYNTIANYFSPFWSGISIVQCLYLFQSACTVPLKALNYLIYNGLMYLILHSDPVVIFPSSVMDESSSVSSQDTTVIPDLLVPSSVTEEPTSVSPQLTTSHLPVVSSGMTTPQPSPAMDPNSRTNDKKETKITLSKLQCACMSLCLGPLR